MLGNLSDYYTINTLELAGNTTNAYGPKTYTFIILLDLVHIRIQYPFTSKVGSILICYDVIFINISYASHTHTTTTNTSIGCGGNGSATKTAATTT